MPEHTFDVHVLRTFKRDLILVLTQLQTALPHPSETINHVIYMLNQTFHDVELLYLVWRHDRVQTTLQHGIFVFFSYQRVMT
jgi:phosphoribosyl-AMP cyclohydrolase